VSRVARGDGGKYDSRMKLLQSPRNPAAGVGCGYLLKLTIGITLLMLANSYLVGLLVQANLGWIPEFLHDVRLYQFCQIFLAFLMVVVQFWVYDRLTDRPAS
jgi:hypothetical protein